MQQISILGCGWLGLPLAKSLLAKNFKINGSTTSQNKLSDLSNCGINSFLIALNENEIIGNFDAFLENSKILIVDIPPKLRGESKENFVQKIKNSIPNIEKSTVEKVIFISSISVFSDENQFVTEETVANPETESGKQLLEVENMLLGNKDFQTTIIRFGGLIGEDRNPIRFLAGKTIQNPLSPINFIHQKDCIGIIQKIIEVDCWNEIFNAVAPFHPSRAVYYSQKAIQMGLPMPTFDHSKPSIGKTISSEKIQKILRYNFSELLF
jgi:nucleoside-diphosphate-sugar epimerase